MYGFQFGDGVRLSQPRHVGMHETSENLQSEALRLGQPRAGLWGSSQEGRGVVFICPEVHFGNHSRQQHSVPHLAAAGACLQCRSNHETFDE